MLGSYGNVSILKHDKMDHKAGDTFIIYGEDSDVLLYKTQGYDLINYTWQWLHPRLIRRESYLSFDDFINTSNNRLAKLVFGV